jgi:Tol biopolymer transport system component
MPMKRLRDLFGLILVGVAAGIGGCSDSGFVTPPRQLLGSTLNTLSAEEHPRFSHDGRYLVFASDRRPRRAIYLYDRLANRLVPLPGLDRPDTFLDQPDISADGRYLVYVAESAGRSDIYVYDRQTWSAENITENLLGLKRNPTISGNGRFVAFESERSGQWDVEVYDRGTGTPLSLPSAPSSPAP